MVKLSERVGKYIDTEEFLKSKSSGFADDESTKAKWKHEDFEKGLGKKQKQDQQKTARDPAPMALAPLSRPIQEVMVAAEAQNLIRKPDKMKSPPKKRNRDKYC